VTDQYKALLATEQVELEFTLEGLRRIAELAWQVNERTENIGARRLHTVMERLLESLSFQAPTKAGSRVVVDAGYVDEQLAELVADDDLSRYIL
jgi:ATP-dependent HslUV protease ATP-binding subunit HslU